MNVYCPKCGVSSPNETLPLDTCVEPTDIAWRCPQCGAQWRIEIEFVETKAEECE